jgi:Ca2+-binding EF-hand superfamily protein
MLFVTPIATRWYGTQFNGGINILPFKLREKIKYLSKFKQSLIQTGLTFGVCAPFFATSYITWMGFTYKDYNKSMIKSEAKKTFLPIVLSDLCFWPCADMINFTIVPQQYRFWAMLLEDIAWASILSIWGNDHEQIDHLHEVVEVHDALRMSSLLIDAFRASEDVFITAAFHILDKDMSSTIELQEIQAFMKGIDIEEDTKKMLLRNAFPNDRDGMGIEEFKCYLKSEEGKILKSVIQFHVIDVDKNGMLSYNEAVAMYGKKYADELWKKLHVFHEEEIDIKTYLKAFL